MRTALGAFIQARQHQLQKSSVVPAFRAPLREVWGAELSKLGGYRMEATGAARGTSLEKTEDRRLLRRELSLFTSSCTVRTLTFYGTIREC